MITGDIRFDVGWIYSPTSLTPGGGLLRNLDRDFAETYESRRVAIETALEKLIDKLDEISFLQRSAE